MLTTAQEVNPAKVLDAVTGTWDHVSGFDRAVLVISDEEASLVDLYLFLSTDNPEEPLETPRLALHKKSLVTRGGLWGMQPSISLGTDSGKLVVYSANDAIGRNRWKQNLTIEYQNERFVVTSFSYTAYDTLDSDYEIDCTLNTLSGEGSMNGEAFRLDLSDISVANWPIDFFPEACKFHQD